MCGKTTNITILSQNTKLSISVWSYSNISHVARQIVERTDWLSDEELVDTLEIFRESQ